MINKNNWQSKQVSIPNKKIRIASRGSMLALWQANYVAHQLEARGAQTEIQVIKTTGDRVQDRFLHEIGGKGLFVKELEQALIGNEADLAVHSLKDMPAQIVPPLVLSAVLKRHSPYDLLIFGPKLASERLNPSPTAATPKPLQPFTASDVSNLGSCTIATGSLRRVSLLAAHAPRAKTHPVRGNVDTRLQKLARGEWDAMILAEASLDRLDLKSQYPSVQLNPDWFIPCASQGALAIECREDSPIHDFVRQALNDPPSEHAVTLERRLLELLGGDCTMPFGCYVAPGDDAWSIKAGIYTPEGLSAATACHVKKPPITSTHQDFPLQRSWVETESHLVLESLRKAGGPKILEQLNLKKPALWS